MKKFRAFAMYIGIPVVLLGIILAINSSLDTSPLRCKQRQLNNVDVEVLEKRVETTHDSDFLFLKTKFVNNTKKGVKIATGNLAFFDLSGTQQYNVDLGYPRAYTVEEGYPNIPTMLVNASSEVNFPLNYFESGGLLWLNTTKFKNMECKWTLHKIIYEDGTEDIFNSGN